MEDKKGIKITGRWGVRLVAMIVLTVLPLGWIIVGLREGAILPTFIREDWVIYVAVMVLSVIVLAKSKEKKAE